MGVLLGFSQGCIIIHLVSALLRSRGKKIPWKLSVLFNGLKVRDNRLAGLFEEKLDQPAVLVFGRQDEFYSYGQKQMDMYVDPIALEHGEGHKFPSEAPRAQEIYDELAKLMLK